MVTQEEKKENPPAPPATEKKPPRKKRPAHSEEPLQVPFTIVRDGREKAGYFFQGLRAGAQLQHRPLVVPTEWSHLLSGDYSLRGCEHLIAVERKSIQDLYSTLGQHRERFEDEMVRLSRMDFAAVVVEASMETLLQSPPERSHLEPKSVFRTIIAWTIRYRVPWFLVEGHRPGEVTTYRILERWWLDLQDRIGETAGHCRICGRELKDHRSWKRGMGPICAARGDRLLAMDVEKGLLKDGVSV